MSKKKTRLSSVNKIGVADQSTKAGASSMHTGSQMLYNSYAPTGLYKISS